MKFLLCIWMTCLPLVADTSNSKTPIEQNHEMNEIYTIDLRIQRLEELKSYYLKKSIRLRVLGDKLYLTEGTKSKKAYEEKWALARHYKELSVHIQDEINNLEQQKKEIFHSLKH